ncbi:MAG: flippase [Parcubacteria group bacterium]
MSIAQHSIFTFGGKIAQVAAVFLIGIILARAIGPEGNGTYELFQLIVTLSVTLGTLGVGHAMVYIIKRKGADIRETISTVFSFGIVWGIFIALLAAVFYSIFPNLIDQLPSNALLIGAIVVPFALLDAFLIQAFLVELKIKPQSILIIGKNIVLIITMFFLVGVAHLKTQGIIYAVSGTYIASSLIVVVVLKRIYNISIMLRPAILKEAFSFGVKNWLGNIFLILNYKVAMLIVNYYLDITSVGLYSVAVAIASSLFLIPSSIGPILYSSWSSKSVEQMDQETPKKTRQIVFIAFIISLCTIAFGRLIIHIFYGSTFIPSYTALMILLPGVIMMTINYVLFNNFASRGKPLINSLTLVVALFINVVLSILLIPQWGINGAAFAATVSYAFSAVVSLMAFYKYRKVPTSNNLVFVNISDIVELRRVLVNMLPKKYGTPQP